MKNDYYYGLIILILLNIGVVPVKSQDTTFTAKYSTVISSGKGQVMMSQCSRSVPNNIDGYFDPTINDIHKLEDHLLGILNLKASGCCLIGGVITDLNKYCFQYVGLILSGKKYIYINAFQIETPQELTTFFKNWKTEPIIMCDGGESAWGILFEISNCEFSQFSINGVA